MFAHNLENKYPAFFWKLNSSLQITQFNSLYQKLTQDPALQKQMTQRAFFKPPADLHLNINTGLVCLFKKASLLTACNFSFHND